MAGSITVATTEVANSGGIKKISIGWTSDASGDVNGNTVTLAAGTIVEVTFIPGTSGDQPTNLYDVTMTDGDGVNVLDDGAGTSVGANLSNTTASRKVPMIGGGSVTYVRQWLHGGAYTPVVAGAGNAKSGTIVIYQSPVVVP